MKVNEIISDARRQIELIPPQENGRVVATVINEAEMVKYDVVFLAKPRIENQEDAVKWSDNEPLPFEWVYEEYIKSSL
jgi:hypothetical protein